MMNGFEFICKLYNIKFTEIARALNIKKQSIACWKATNNGVPANRVDAILVFFNQKGIEDIDKNTIIKTLDENDMNRLEMLKIKRDLNNLNKSNSNNNKLEEIKRITSNIETELIKSNINIDCDIYKIYEELTNLLVSQELDATILLKKIKETI